MNVVGGGFLFLVTSAIAVCDFVPDSDRSQDFPRYVVFPGLDAEAEEIEEWNIGFASPFNVFFGPKPYALGWLSEAPFGPTGEEGEEGEIDGEGDYEIEEGDEGDEGEAEEEEGDYEEPGYPDYEKA